VKLQRRVTLRYTLNPQLSPIAVIFIMYGFLPHYIYKLMFVTIPNMTQHLLSSRLILHNTWSIVEHTQTVYFGNAKRTPASYVICYSTMGPVCFVTHHAVSFLRRHNPFQQWQNSTSNSQAVIFRSFLAWPPSPQHSKHC